MSPCNTYTILWYKSEDIKAKYKVYSRLATFLDKIIKIETGIQLGSLQFKANNAVKSM